MERLNKKLSETIQRKTGQLEAASLKYLLSICFIVASIRSITGLNPYQDTLVTIGLFWIALLFEGDRLYIHLSALLLSAFALNRKAFLAGVLFATALVFAQRVLFQRGKNGNLSLLLAGVLTHIGDLFTTHIGLQRQLSEQNPFLQYLGNFVDISQGLVISKTFLFLIAIYFYKRKFEGLNSLLKIFVVSGFLLTLTNLQIILSGI